ncbi:MAG: EutN/CcmL family microcompartment protein [Planctomycetaceae bacterium]|nr:EutN/CcmL family microcompartment protein [Planctomycetaceae bacterium]
MRVAKVVGTVTLNRCLPSYQGARLKLLMPLATHDLAGGLEPSDDALVAWDELGAALGSFVAVAEGSEAAQPFRPAVKPVDAYVAAILDELEVDPNLVKSILE